MKILLKQIQGFRQIMCFSGYCQKLESKVLILRKLRWQINQLPRERYAMAILNTISLEGNKQIKINFNGCDHGCDFSSDEGCSSSKNSPLKSGLQSLKKIFIFQYQWRIFTTWCSRSSKIIATYLDGNSADELTNDPVLIASLGKEKSS